VSQDKDSLINEEREGMCQKKKEGDPSPEKDKPSKKKPHTQVMQN